MLTLIGYKYKLNEIKTKILKISELQTTKPNLKIEQEREREKKYLSLYHAMTCLTGELVAAKLYIIALLSLKRNGQTSLSH